MRKKSRVIGNHTISTQEMEFEVPTKVAATFEDRIYALEHPLRDFGSQSLLVLRRLTALLRDPEPLTEFRAKNFMDLISWPAGHLAEGLVDCWEQDDD